MTRFRCRPALAVALLLTACLTPTDGSGRFGEARVRPQFSAGNAPDELGVAVDSMRTVMRRGTDTLVDAVKPYQAAAAQAWIIELASVADDVDVLIELRVGQNVAYEGQRVITVQEGSAGRADVENVPVAYIATDIAARVEVVPDQVAFSGLGHTRQLQAVVHDPNDVVITGKTVAWTSANGAVATVDAAGLVTAAGQGNTSITASVDGVSGTAAVLVDTALHKTTTINADSASIAADGAARTLITVRILDASGQAVGGSTGNVTLATSLGTLAAVVDHNDGTYTATLTAGTTTGNALVTGTLNGVAIEDSALVVFRSLTADPTTTTVTADSSALNADGLSSTVLRVRVLDANGNPVGVSAGTVTLATTLGTLSAVTDHADGSYSATLTAESTAGLAIISGTLNGATITDTAGVQLRPLPGSSTTSTITADSIAIDANGTSATAVTVRVLDVNGNSVGASAGTVTLTTSLGTLSAVTDHADGTYSATLTGGTVAGVAVISGALNGATITDTAGVQLRPLPGSGTTSTITADSIAIDANGTSTTVVRVRVLDLNGNSVGASAGTVTLATTLGTLSAVTDHADGTYTATLTAGTLAGVAVISGTLNGMAITDTAGVDLRALPASPTTSTLTADSAAIDANGAATTMIRVRVLDVYGNPVGASAGTVTLAATLGTLSTVTDHADGTYTATLTAGMVPGLAVIGGTLNGAALTDTAVVQLRPLPGDPTTATITADSAVINADGVASTVITVRVFDANGNALNGSAGTVVLATTRGTLSAVIDHGDGTYTATLTAGTTPGLAIISGTLNGVAIADSAHVELREVGPKEVGGVGQIFRIPFKALSMNGKATEPPEATLTVKRAP